MKPPPKIRKTVDRPPLTARRILWDNPTAKKIWLGVGAIALLAWCMQPPDPWTKCMTDPQNMVFTREARDTYCRMLHPQK